MNQVLSLLVLSATFIYTVIQIADKVNKKEMRKTIDKLNGHGIAFCTD